MGVTIKKYRILVSFCRKLMIFSENDGQNLWILSEILKKIKNHKNSYTGPLRLTDLEYGSHDHEVQSFGQFLPQTGNFQ
jgi:hypothetical protein